ncbi:mandelate racemase/muconate lactonizing enzyme family protein [Enterocloster lavalensis]|uniref:mandelate racemase/muconate lactonizing enzyme family protein n=1 Tax=Enterocloster lavalensis TaxID=460384 RepID=UPI001D088FFB|nr:mandelate racemase/muconate lactonizing enzyme family protein [Enterocloster lavalensis]MCB6342936.1 mandelate racemase/muconate lactonizing enzyme family protein [Enterocloster lavalensis]
MRITDVELIAAKHYLFVKVHTDMGITGLGEAGNWGFLDATAGAVRKFSEFLIGQDPFQIEHHYQNMYRAMYFRGSVLMSAISALEIALWDIKGKALGVPVYELLGGKTRNKVRTYCSGLSDFNKSSQEIAEEFARLKEQGFTASKIFLPEDATTEHGEREFFANKVEIAVDKVRSVREAVGMDFDLILEVHRCMSVPEAVAFAKAVEPLRPMVLEDPITPDDVDAMAYVAGKTTIPIATGERFIYFNEFQALLRRDAARYVRPDVCAIGGINASRKVAAMAEANNVLVIPHNPLGPVSTAACLQLCACISNVGIMELPSFMMNGAEDAMVKEPIRVHHGCLIVPDRPGIGIELAENVTELFPARDRAQNHAHFSFDGSVRDW